MLKGEGARGIARNIFYVSGVADGAKKSWGMEKSQRFLTKAMVFMSVGLARSNVSSFLLSR